MRPGVDVISRALPPPRSAPTDTGVAFIVGATVTTNISYKLVHSMTEYVAVFGARTGVGNACYDAADAYFQEGGNQLYVAPTNAVGPFILESGVEIADSEPEPEPKGKGKSGNGADTQALDAGVTAALGRLTEGLGPGQILLADPLLAADPANQSALLAHAAANNRVALLSATDGTSAALTAAATALHADTNARYGALFAPSAVIPGVTAGTTRTVPYTAIEAGIIARNDVSFSQNQAAAGDLGQSLYALDIAGRYTDLEYQNLNAAGVDMARVIYGGVRTYGYRSVVDSAVMPQWQWFGWARLNMAITADANAIGEHYVFSQIDGRGHTISEFGGELSAMLAGYYEEDSLYGATPQDAYAVDVSSSVNTPTTIANGELHAVLTVRMSPGAEWVVIEIVKVASNQALPGTAALAA
jgi:hypothetical protein